MATTITVLITNVFCLLVSCSWRRIASHPQDVHILDVRGAAKGLGDYVPGYDQYLQGHIPGERGGGGQHYFCSQL